MECPSCKHAQSSHMKEKAKDWPAHHRHQAACHCGCGITREEIEAHHNKQAQKNDDR